jgi:hypothetical protein
MSVIVNVLQIIIYCYDHYYILFYFWEEVIEYSEISGSQDSKCEDGCLLGYCAM